MNVISYKDVARDFSNSGITSLNTFGVGDSGQEAENAYHLNELEDQLNTNLETNDGAWYEEEEGPRMGIPGNTMNAGAYAINAFTTLFGERKYQGEDGQKTNFASQLVNINTRDALTINIQSRQKELMETEGQWIPQMEEAKSYLTTKQEIISLKSQIDSIPDDQLNTPQATQLLQQYKQLTSNLQEQEQKLRTYTNNPYLTDIFYGDAEDVGGNPIVGRQKIEGSRIRTLMADGKLSPYWEDLSWKQNNNELDKDSNLANSLLSIKSEKLAQKLDNAQEEFESKSGELKKKQQSLKTAHMLHDPLLGIVPLGIIYDPNAIDPILDKARSEEEISITDPSSWKYGMLHLGSSYSEIQGMATQMLISGAIKYGSKIAGAYTGPAAPLIWATGEAAVNLMSTAYFRHKETAAEVMSNYSEKIANAAADGAFDLNTVLEDYSNQLNTMGYEADKMSDLEKLQFGLAYNLKTQDQQYNQFAKDARQGLTRIEEANNALALSDYAQNFGLSYGGKLVKDAVGFKAIFNKVAQVANKNKNTASVIKAVTSKVDKAVDKVLKTPASKIAAKRVRDAGTDIALRLGKNWIAERSEEGVQGLIGREYQEAPLKPDAKPEQYNILRGALKTAELAVEANLAYHGLHWNDLYNTDEQLKREMEIGGFIGTFMGGVGNYSNVNDLRKQLRSDNHVKALAAEGFDNADMSYKAAQFLDSYRKHNTPDFMKTSLESYKQYKSEGVTDAMIDEDIQLANSVWSIYNNKAINPNLQELDIDKKEDKSFELFVQNAVNVQKRFDDAISSTNTADYNQRQLLTNLIADNSSNEFNTFIDQQYDRYTKEAGDNAVSKAEFKTPIVNAVNAKVTNRVLTQLKKDLKDRKQTLQDLNKKYGISTSVAGIEGILQFIEESQNTAKALQQQYDDSMFKGTLKNLKEPADVEELEKAVAISILNQGVAHSLRARIGAYQTGRVSTKDRYLIEQKPLFSTLDKESKQKVLTKYAEKYKEDKHTDKEPTQKQVISYYNHQVNQQWNDVEQSANVESTERSLANMLIQQDLTKAFEELDQAKVELDEETGFDAANTDGVQVETSEVETTVVEEPATEEPKIATPPEDEPTGDKADTSQETAVSDTPVDETVDRTKTTTPITDTVEESTESSKPVDIDTLLDEVAENGYDPSTDELVEETVTPVVEAGVDSVEEVDDVSELRAKYDRILEGEPLAEIDEVEEVNEVEPGSNRDIDEDTVEPESVESATQTTEETTETTEETAEEPEVSTETQKTVTPTTEVKKPRTTKEEQPVLTITVESFDGATDEEVDVPLEDPSTVIYSDGTDVWVGNEDPGLGVPISEEEITMQNMFEETDAVDMSTTEEARLYLGQTDKSPGLDTKQKVESNRIHSTFFFAPTSTEPMPIVANGQPVIFDGIRKSGSELAEKLVIPGWLEKQKAYYIVTDSKETRKTEQDAVDRLAIHLIIEEDVDGTKNIYNTALYEPAKALSKIRKWSVSRAQQNDEIRKLRELRKRIVDKYISTYAPNYFSDPKVGLPQTAPKGIVPVGLRQSNGSINSQSENKRPVYRSLTDVAEFGLSKDPVEMSRQILEGEVEFGFGKGPFPLDLDDRFAIVHFDNETYASAQGVGYAGKLYIVPKVENTPSRRVSVPIMLAEKRHFIPGGSKNFITSYTPSSKAKYDDNGVRVPLTSAELLFRLVTRSIPVMQNPVYFDILKILGHNGPTTVNVGDIRIEKLSFYARKTLYRYQNKNNEEMLMYAARTPQGEYQVKHLKIKDAAGRVVFTDEQANAVIRQMSNNLHWNTDKETMLEPISDNIVKEAISYMNQYNTDYYRVLNCDDLIFTMEDLNLERVDGKVVRKDGPTPILMSWMINHQIIKTDVGEHVFTAPFVYADDVAVAETSQISNTTESTKVKPAKQKVTPTETVTEETPKEVVKKPEVKEVNGLKIPANDRALSYDETVAMGLVPKQGFTYVLRADGSTVILPNSSKIIQQMTKGVYSVERGVGKVDLESAKQWLFDKLGLSTDNVLVTNAVMKMADAPQVYGVLQASFNRILSEFRPQIVLSSKAGEGIEYHEAWHYVSLMVLDEAQRNQVYSDYVKHNPQYKDYTKAEIEEQLAEEFRSYMILEQNPTFGYRVLKFFRALKELMNVFGSKRYNIQSNLFNAIRTGKFKDSKVSQEVLEQFNKEHPSGVNFYAPGIGEHIQKRIPHITNASTMYNLIESLSSTALATLNITSMEDVQNLKLDTVFDIIQYMYDGGEYDASPTRKQIIDDVLQNKGIFADQIRLFLQELGIRSIEQEETRIKEEEALQNGDAYDNIWDRASYEISKKANTAFNAKLFLYSIPQSKFVLDENGVQQLESVKDNIFGLDLVQPFDITWNKVLDNLWQSNDWPDLLSKVRVQAKADPFFARLLEKIDNPAFPLPENTVTQLLTTIQSAKNSMDTVMAMTDNTAQNVNKALGRRIWLVQDSDNLRKIARLPNNWSQNFMVSSMVETDSQNRSIINNKQFQKLKKLDNQITNGIRLITASKDTAFKVNTFEELKEKFLDLVNMIGIPFDNEALTYLLNNIKTKNVNNIPGFDAFVAIYTAKDKQVGANSKRLSGSIGNSVLRNIQLMKDRKALELQFKKQTISGSRIFNYKNPNAVINLMAIAYGETHPTPEEFSVTGADGSLLFPITQNNYMSDQVRWLNSNAYNKLTNLNRASYSANSLIVDTLNKGGKLKLHTLIAINEDETDTSRDYFGISPLEDYITKMVLLAQGRIILPTMSDKKTWYSIEGVDMPRDFLYSTTQQPDNSGGFVTVTKPRRFSDDTLNIFYNYFVDEYNTIVQYYKTKSEVEKSKSRYYDNYHGKIGKDGKMKPGGNGGKFRYFNQLPINGELVSLNKLLTDAEESGDTASINNVLDNIRAMFIDDVASMHNILNDLLLSKVDDEIQEALKIGAIKYDSKGNLTYGNLPSLNTPKDEDNEGLVNVFSNYSEAASVIPDEQVKKDDTIYSMIANYVTGYAISIEELEKCFVGDPAMYKWKSNDKVGIFQRDVDKIKRLSSVLSTGDNLRTYWGEADPRNSTKFVSMVMQDNMVASEYHEQLESIFKASFARTMLKKNNPEYTDNELFELTTGDEALNAVLKDRNLLSEDDVDFIEQQAKKAANPYAYDEDSNSGNINQADAAVYIRPAFYKKIMQSLGQWSDDIEEAYNILESEDNVLQDPELYAKSLKASIKPLKLMYFGDYFDDVSKVNVPTFDKMAIFPMFKILATADNKNLYDRMNNEQLGIIDMIKFESAVKVGSPRDKFKPYTDYTNSAFNVGDLNKPSSMIVTNDTVEERLGDNITTRVQDITQLRLQLNTEPHEAVDRSFGTQAIKIGMGNVVDERTYGENKGVKVTGSKIKNDIFGTIKALSSKGRSKVQSRFFKKDGTLNNTALSQYLVKEARGTNMSMEIIEALRLNKQGHFIAPIASLSVRNWIESKIISLINKEVIDVNTPGGSAIQMSSFGFRKSQVGVQTSDSTIQQNKVLDTNLKELMSIKAVRFLTTNNLTTARDLIMYGKTKLQKYGGKQLYTEFVQMLDELQLSFDADTSLSAKQLGTYASYNNGNKLSFEPSKGSMEVMLSTNFFRSVIPEEYQTDYTTMRNWLIEHNIIGNNAKPYGVGYRIPTQGLSSTFSFIVADVLPEQTGDTIVVPDEFTAMTGSDFDIDKLYIATYSYDPTTNERYAFDDSKSYDDQSEGALINKLLDSYTLVISDEKTLSETRASIDTLTGILKKDILPKVQSTVLKEAEPMYELAPSFQESRKTEYTSGKAGIAPFALNSTNHCLTQAVHLKMKYSRNATKYGLGDLDAIDGQDHYKILDWLSAMINAHVDVAKDPYIITLNVNKVTYNMTNLLLRGGKGKLTFFFLAQPAIKDFTNTKIANDGVIGTVKQYDDDIMKSIKEKYQSMLESYQLTDEQKTTLENGSTAFSEEHLSKSLEGFKKKDPSVDDIITQLVCLKAYSELSNDAQILADLVHRSQIDTKKYGNNISQLQNFNNSYYTFIEDNKNKFVTDVEDNLGYDTALQMYFGETFLHQKLVYATDLANRILENQIFAATAGYKTLFSNIAHNIMGGKYMPITNNDYTLQLYKPVSNKDLVKKLNDRIESIVRARVIMNNTDMRLTDDEVNDLLYGQQNISKQLNSIKNYVREHKDDPSIITLVDGQGNIKNDMLNYLQAITTSKKTQLNRITTSTSSMNNSRHMDDRLISSFYDLLTNDDPIISDFAKLLVKYSFLTTYDNRTPNSFFQLVPTQYKQELGYIDAISDTITKLNMGDISTIGGAEDVNNLSNSIYLTLARNYWKDNDIVPIYTRRVNIGENGSWSNTFDLASASDTTRQNVNTVISVRSAYDVNKNQKFIKIIGGRKVATLYQKVGSIIDLDNNGKTVELIYVAVPKLGLDAGSNSIYELYKDGNEQSAFESNKFTDKMIEQTTTGLDDLISNHIKGKPLQYVKDPEYLEIDIAQYVNPTEQAIQITNESEQVDNVTDDTTTIQSEEFVDQSPTNVDNELGIVDDDVIDFLDDFTREMDPSIGVDITDVELDLNSLDVIDEIFDSTTEELPITKEDSTVEALAKKGKQRKKECE